MTKQHKPSAAALLRRAVQARQRRQPEPASPTEGDFGKAIARRLKSLGIATVPGLADDEPMQWYDVAIELDRRHREFEAERERRRQAEAAAKDEPRTAAGALATAIAAQANSSHSTAIPLNGAAVLRAALAGSVGTINGR